MFSPIKFLFCLCIISNIFSFFQKMLLQQCVRVRHHISRSVTAVLKCRNEPVHSCLGYTQCWRHSRSLKHHHLCTRTYSSETGSPPGSQSHAGEDVEEKQENTPASRILEEASLGGDDLDFPSDVDTQTSHKTYNDWNRDQTKTSFRPSVDPSTTSVLLFPGQGSQFPGMGKELLKYPNARRMYDVASAILGYDLLEICLNGPPERLMRTEFCQPAIYVTSLAAIEKLKEENPKVGWLTHWGRDQMDAISQTTSSSAFSWMKMFEFRLKFQWSLFLRVQLTIFQHWFR